MFVGNLLCFARVVSKQLVLNMCGLQVPIPECAFAQYGQNMSMFCIYRLQILSVRSCRPNPECACAHAQYGQSMTMYLQAPNIACAIMQSKPRMRMRTRAVWPEHDHVSTGSKYCLCDRAVQTQNAHAHTRSMARAWPCIYRLQILPVRSCRPNPECACAHVQYGQSMTMYLQAPNIACAIVHSKPRMRMRTRAVWPEWPCVVSAGSKYCLYESCSPRTDCARANCAYAVWSLPAKFVYAMRHVLSRRGSE